MAQPTRAERWRLHGALLLGVTVCVIGFVVELSRGVSGHLLAWAYVVEWPLFAVVGLVVWWRLLHDDGSADEPTPSHGPTTIAPDDPELKAWQDHVARLDAERGDE